MPSFSCNDPRSRSGISLTSTLAEVVCAFDSLPSASSMLRLRGVGPASSAIVSCIAGAVVPVVTASEPLNDSSAL